MKKLPSASSDSAKSSKTVRLLVQGVKGTIRWATTFVPRWRLFDSEYYRRAYPDVAEAGVDCEQHFYEYGWREGRNPHPLFNTHYYLRQIGSNLSGHPDPLTHYEKEGYKFASPHPLFDREYYLEQSPELGTRADALSHYLFGGGAYRKDPTRLFHTSYYLEQEPDLPSQTINPLAHYLEFGWKAGHNPNYLFDSEFLFGQLTGMESGSSPLERFIKCDGGRWNAPHVAFEPKPYLERLAAAGMRDPSIDCSAKLLAFYLLDGWRRDVSPCNLFDFRFYRAEIGGEDVDPLYHYFCCDGHRHHSFNPALDLGHYRANNPEAFSEKEVPLLHLMRNIDRADCHPHPFMDRDWYISAHSDVKETGVSAARHFLTVGLYEGRRRLNSWFSERAVWNKHPEESFANVTAHCHYLRTKSHTKPRLLFVGHDASLTGAPKILLRLIQDVALKQDVEPFLLLMKGGDLLGKYREYAHTHVINWGRGVDDCLAVRGNVEAIQPEVLRLLRLLGGNKPIAAICNTIETSAIARMLKDAGIPVVSLVHEMASQYHPSVLRDVIRNSSRMVFPSRAAERAALGQAQLQAGSYSVIPQGLLDDQFGLASRKRARMEVLSKLGLGADSTIVLGSGTADERKGFDLFCEVAAKMKRNAKRSGTSSIPVFVWVGGKAHRPAAEREPIQSAVWWARRSLAVHEAEKDLVHIEQVDDIEPYFLAADIFFLSSRSDPFPNVVLEAMACGLPVVYFKNAGGADEVVGDDAGVGVAFADVEEAASEIDSLYRDPSLRERLGTAGAARVRLDYQFGVYANKLLGVCRSVGLQDFPIIEIPQGKTARARRVYFLSPDWIISGVNTFTETLATELNFLGYEAQILFTRGRFAKLPAESAFLPRVRKMFLQPDSGNHRAIWENVIDFFRKHAHEPCIVVPNYDFTAASVIPILPSSVGVVGIAHSDDDDHYEQSCRLGIWYNRLVTVSEHIRRRLIEFNGSLAAKTSTIHYGVEDGKTDTGALWEKKFIDASAPLELVYAGRFVRPQKRIDRYVELARILNERQVPFHLTMIGDGPEMDWVRGRLEPMIATGQVELTGRLSRGEIDARMEKAHVFLLLSEYEGLPLAVLEAMSRGCVTVAMHIDSGLPDIIHDAGNGFLRAQGDMRGVVAAIESLASDRARLRAMAEQAKASFHSQKLSAKDMARQYAALFDEVFAELEQGRYQRPPSFGHRSFLPGAMPPPWLS